MEKYLIAIDLDGTLIEGLYDLGEYSIKVFKRVKELGHKIVIVTGRPFRSSYFVYKAFDLDSPLVNYNGSLILDPKTNKVLFSDEMKREDIIKLYNDKKGTFVLFFCEYFDHVYTTSYNEGFHLLMHDNELCTIIEGDLNKILDTNIHGSLILAKDGYGKEIMDYVNDNFTNFKARLWAWGPYKEIVELYSTSSDKGTALKFIRDYYHLTKEEVIACGDSQNDFDFFKEAGTTVSLINADPRVKALSTYVYNRTCIDEGIAHFFNEFFNLGIDK